jgi:hypothetical protein
LLIIQIKVILYKFTAIIFTTMRTGIRQPTPIITTASTYGGDGDNGSDTIQNIFIYDNTFGGSVGANATAHVFMETNAGSTKDVYISNNVLIYTTGSVTDHWLGWTLFHLQQHVRG